MKKAIVILSGGMDSATVAYHVKEQGYEIHSLSFDYGQRHLRELDAARTIARVLGIKHSTIDLIEVGELLKGSALTDTIDVPDGHYTEASMKLTVVPNRNALFLSIAWGVAVAEGAEIVAAGMHAGDHLTYPDCRPDFIAAMDHALRLATEGHRLDNLHLYVPFLLQTKGQIVQEGNRLGVPFAETWTCYKGGDQHCGTCGACRSRQDAFKSAGVDDPTTYQHGG